MSDFEGIATDILFEELHRILGSKYFVNSRLASRFLRFSVEKAIQGQASSLKEYTIGVGVYGKGESFDPRTDPIVRVEARRIRSKLLEYYRNEGRNNALCIFLPVGRYVPIFGKTQDSVLPKVPPMPPRSHSAPRSAEKQQGSSSPFARNTSIAVLPFENLDDGRVNARLCDGLSLGIVNALTKLKGLHVSGGGSGRPPRGKTTDARKIGHLLNVEKILHGSVHRLLNKLLITVRVSNTSDGRQIWSETYERGRKEISVLPREISRAIADTLQVTRSSYRPNLAPSAPAECVETYQQYLKGHHYIHNWSPEGLKKAIEFFEQVLVEDPTCAVAWTLVADAYFLLSAHGLLPACRVMPKVKAASLKALELDNSLVGAHTLLALVRAHYDWNWDEAEREYQYALKLNPGYGGGHQWYSWCLAMSGRSSEAIREGRQSLEIDPLSAVGNTHLGWLYYLARDFSRAREQYHRSIALDPNFFWPYLRLGTAYAAESLLDEAIQALVQARNLSSESPVSLGILGHCYALSGNVKEARKLLSHLNKLSQARYVSSLHIAFIHIGLGEANRALELLQEAVEERHPYIGILKTAPIFDSVRSDRRFSALLKQMNL